MSAHSQRIQKRVEEKQRNNAGARRWVDLNPGINNYTKCKSSKLSSKKAEVFSWIRGKAGTNTMLLIRNLKYGDTNRVEVTEWENRQANTSRRRAGVAVLISRSGFQSREYQ